MKSKKDSEKYRSDRSSFFSITVDNEVGIANKTGVFKMINDAIKDNNDIKIVISTPDGDVKVENSQLAKSISNFIHSK